MTHPTLNKVDRNVSIDDFIANVRVQANGHPTLTAGNIKSRLGDLLISLRCGPSGLPDALYSLYMDASRREQEPTNRQLPFFIEDVVAIADKAKQE